jgi:transcriptional regulator with XRE-family HTH domain
MWLEQCQKEATVSTFQEWLTELVEKAGGWRPAAAKCGLSHATLLRAAGRMDGAVSLDTLQAIARWANVPLSYVLERYVGDTHPDMHIVAKVEQLRAEHPELVDVLDVAAKLDENTLREVLAYIKFKIMQREGRL